MTLQYLNIFVTGGAGFIGSHLVDVLLSKNNTVVLYDNFSDFYTGKEENIKHNLKKSNFRVQKSDIMDYEKIRKNMQNVDVVFHLAAQPGVRFSMENPNKTSDVNILGTLNVLKAAKEAEVETVIFASTSSVYGEPKYLPIDENNVTKPISIYGASKLAAEKYCQVFNDQLGLEVIILRYHTVYGPRQRPDMAFHKWTKALSENKPIIIYGDGKQSRDFTFVSDIINGTIKAAETDDIGGEIFNLGGGSNVTVNYAVDLLTKEFGSDTDQIIYETSKLGDVSDTYANIKKAQELIGFNPTTKLKDGLKLFVNWYRNKLTK